MKLLVADGQRQAEEAAARGEEVAVWGPSPGFRELRWIRPVLAGDTISFSNQVETKRTSEKRPEWGILQARNTGTNQRGELVFSFLATAFVPRAEQGSRLTCRRLAPCMVTGWSLPHLTAIDDSSVNHFFANAF